jgi:hypothetical protein
MQNQTTNDCSEEEYRLERLNRIQQFAVCLIQFSELEKAGLGTSDIDWLGRYAKRITKELRELHGLDPEEPQDGELTPCLILSGGHDFGTESYSGKVKLRRSHKDNVEVAIPMGMKWNAAIANLQKVLDDLEFMINCELDTTIETLDMVAEGEERQNDQFGLCPACHQLNLLDIDGETFGVCHDHKVWWTVGKVFGTDHQTTEEREANFRTLAEYTKVSPHFHPRPETPRPPSYQPDPFPPF